MSKLFRLVWRKRLEGYRLVKITGWRSCIVDSDDGSRVRVSFCPWGMK